MSSPVEPEPSDSATNEIKEKQLSKPRRKPSAPRRKEITFGTRLEIIQKLEKGATIQELMVEYGLHQKTIQRYQRNVKSLREISKCPQNLTMMRKPRDLFEDISVRLYEWVMDERKKGKVWITDSMLQKKAKEFHESKFGSALASKFVASGGGRGWLYRFKQRYNVFPNYVHETIINDSELTTKQLSKLISELNMDKEDVYIMHKTCLLWKKFPKKINPNIKLPVKNGTKDYIALAFCANIVGTHKLPLLFVHKYAVPPSLKNCKDPLPVIYKHQLYTSIDKNLFNDWYVNHFQCSVRQRQKENRRTGKVMLLINNFKTDISYVKMFDSSDFKLIVLPPYTTSAILPISTKCKKLFWHKLLQQLNECSEGIDKFSYTIKDCIFLISEAWNEITRADFEVSWQKFLGDQEVRAEDTKSRPDFETVFVQGEPEVKENVDSEQMESLSSCDDTLKVEELHLDEDVQTNEWTVKLEEKEVVRMFHNLEIWAETQSDFIKSCAKVLINYYNER
ncbi:jerky protein homolog-like [Ceratina calcarata]|uniref:Jerky protein homolog-like n=1 Tax=Ceratina calcarata TaxID=156304 RepID=A0AAJ7JDS0_9HYME|nr:jerky protein homolog-like [Ceratina calcarata]